MTMKQRVILIGDDAIDLLHRISTLDLKRLVLNQWVPGLILSVQGKILSYFEVKKTNPSTLEVQFEDQFLTLLDQYTFGERYTLTPAEPLLNTVSLTETNRILAMQPKQGNEFNSNGESNPLEVNLSHAIHENKGCYPGQEVIEKIISLGSPARKLCLLENTSSPESASAASANLNLPLSIFDITSGAEVGQLTSLSPDSKFALGILKRTHLKVGIQIKTAHSTFTLQKVQP